MDIDVDGDLDLLVAASWGHGFRWYENEDGLGTFGEGQEVVDLSNSGGGLNVTVHPSDIDGDGDLDLLLNLPAHDEVVWYENEDGLGTFGAEKPAFSPPDSVYFVNVLDFDGDGDVDVLTASWNRVVLYENENGLGSFGAEQIIDDDIINLSSLSSSDVDGDGDLDILLTTNNSNDENVFWYENIDGSATFGNKLVIASANGNPRSIVPVDFDGDNDLDILYYISGGDNSIVWQENVFEKSKLLVNCFLDENENGTLDNAEIGLNDQILYLEPNTTTSWTNDAGFFRFFLDAGTYLLTHDVASIWEPTNPSSVSLEIDDSGQEFVYNFGVKPNGELLQAELDLNSGPTRCGFAVPFWLNLANTGNQTVEGNITLELDPLVTLISTAPAPTSILGNTLTWELNDLYPTYDEGIKIFLGMPGVDFLGEIISFKAGTNLTDINGNNTFSDSYIYESEINCAYDPNDKLVQPDIEGEENYTLFEDTLNYTVRFQNTGTDTAFNIVIEDQLDTDLDWTTFRPTSSSHPFEVTLSQSGLISFQFSNILLPDSTTNEPASHGFIKYKIQPKANLAENTIVENFASIFFDFNPPIVTNQTVNTLVSLLPTSTKDLGQKPRHVKVAPNPFAERTILTVDGLDHPEQHIIHLLDITGRIINAYSLNPSGMLELERGALASGLYFYQLSHRNHAGVIEAGKLMIE